MKLTFTLDNPPVLALSRSPAGWEASTHLQVGPRTFRYYTHDIADLEGVCEFLKRWNANWAGVALELWDYDGPEEYEEPDLEHKLSPSIAKALARILPEPKPIRRRI